MPRDAAQPAIDRHALALVADAATEQALVRAIQQGDVEAFRTLHERYAVELLRFAHSYLRSRDDAEEIVQDLFLWIWEHRHEWNAPGGVRPYLFKATRNRAHGWLRKRRTQELFSMRVSQGHDSAASTPASPPDPLMATTAGELDAVLSETVAALPPRCREVFLLVRECGLPHGEVAALLDISPKTVEVHMNRALGALRRRVAEWRGG